MCDIPLQQALKAPIVACDLGRLYNKEAIIQYLLSRKECRPSEMTMHIRSLKDITVLNFTNNPAFRDTQSKGAEYVDHGVAEYICPATGLEMNGKYKFIFNRSCGCVFSDRARKNVHTEKCLKCGGQMDPMDLITLNPDEEERKMMENRMIERKTLRKKVKREVEIKSEEEISKSKKVKTEGDVAIKTEAGGSTLKKMKKDQLDKQGPSTSSTAGSAKLLLPQKAQSSYSIAKDPNASEALKSLFTTHESAKNKPKAHWITHNPLFY